jgi:pyruvate, water dikinase
MRKSTSAPSITASTASGNIRWFCDIRLADVGLVGGKNASLGELFSVLSVQGVRVPNEFALTADAYPQRTDRGRSRKLLHPIVEAPQIRLINT